MRVAHRLVLVIAVAALGCHAHAGAQHGSTADDLPHRDMAIHWPKAFDPGTAPLFSHNELLIHADCHRVFTRMADPVGWPNWFVLTKDVAIGGPDKGLNKGPDKTLDKGPDKTLRPGTLLRLTVFGTPITARIDEFVPDARLSWIPMTGGEAAPRHYHSWHFVPEANGCRVITEETGIAAEDVKLGRQGDSFMHRAHELWLASLRWTSEE